MEETSGNILYTLYGSIVSSIVSKVILYPLDTLKTNKQVEINIRKSITQKKKGILNRFFFYSFLQKFGFKNLYCGFVYSLITTIPATSLYFCSYEYIKLKANKIKNKYVFNEQSGKNEYPNRLNSFDFFCIGYLTEAISCSMFVPTDVIKEKMQAQALLGLKRHKRSSALVKDIVYTQGISRLYKGYYTTLLSYGSFSGLFFCFQNIGEKWMKQHEIKSSILNNLYFNSSLSFIAALITTPLETVKTRFQVQEKNQTPFYYLNTKEGLKKLWKEGGIINFYKGSWYRSFTLCLYVSINIAIIDAVKNSLTNSNSSEQKSKIQN